MMNYRTARIKQRTEQLLISPLVLLGRLIGLFYKIDNPSGIYLINARFDAGGSIKANADITKLIADRNPLLIFTKKKKDGKFRNLFDIDGVQIMDISAQIDNKLFHFVNVVWRGILASWINRHENPIVFGGEAIYFYKLLPYLKKGTKRMEIIHVNKWMNYNQSFIPFMDLRIFSAKKVMKDYLAHYKKSGVPVEYNERLMFIDNFVDIPAYSATNNEHIKVLFVGRNSPQKRPELVVRIAQKVIEQNASIEFTLVGDLEKFSSAENKQLKILTNVSSQAQLQDLYKTHDVLLLTSKFEGLPIVVMDMMANGRVVVSTSADGIRDNIIHKESGILIDEIVDEDRIVNEGCEYILALNEDKALREKISTNARKYAAEMFNYDLFKSKYVALFEAMSN